MSDDGWVDGPAPVDRNAYALARMVESEAGGTPEAAQRGVAHAALNYAGGRPIVDVLTHASGSGNGRFGRQDEGRYASTSKEPSPASLRIAQDALSGRSTDPTGGATQWDSPQAYPDPSRAAIIAAARAQEGKHVVTLPGVPSHVLRFYRKGDSATSDDGWVDGPASKAAPAKSEPSYALTDYGGRENKAGPVTDALQSQGPGDVDLSETRAARAAANGFATPQQQLEHDYRPEANPTPAEAARGFLGIAGGAAAGMLTGQVPRIAAMAEQGGLGARMASGAAQGLATAGATTDPNADRKSQIMNLLLGTGLGAAGQRSPRESAYAPGSQGAIDEAAYAARGQEPSLIHGGTRTVGQHAPVSYDKPSGFSSLLEKPIMPPAGPPRGQGSIGTEQAARELEAHIHARVEARNKANGEFIGNDQKAMAEAYRQQNPDGMIDTDPALAAIARIRQQQMGPSGSFMPEQDARLAWAQGAMKQPPPEPGMDTGGIPEPLPEMPPTTPTTHQYVGPEADAAMADAVRPPRNSFVPPNEDATRPNVVPQDLHAFQSHHVDPADIISSRDANADTQLSVEDAQKLWHALNHRIKNAQPGDMGTAGDRQAAGVVGDLVQNADPRLGPGNLEGTAQAYGKEKDNVARLADLTWRNDNGMPPDRVGQQTTGIGRLGNAGATKETSTVGQQAEQQNLREIEKLEPSTSPLMAEIRARRTQERRAFGFRGGVGVQGTIARSTIGNASNAMFRGQGGGVPGTTPDNLILTIEEMRKYNELRRKQQEGQQ